MVVEYMDRALVPTWTFLLETFLRPYPEAQTIVEPAVVSNLLTFFRFICARDERFSGFFRFAGVVLVALVLLALRALLCVALRRPALPCVRFVFSGRDELISTRTSSPYNI